MITYSHANGMHTARLDTVHANPGRLLASALPGQDGWYVSHRAGGGYHLMYVATEDDASALLRLVAGELGT